MCHSIDRDRSTRCTIGGYSIGRVHQRLMETLSHCKLSFVRKSDNEGRRGATDRTPKKKAGRAELPGRPAILDATGSPPAPSNCLHARAEERRGREGRGRTGVAAGAGPGAGLDRVDLVVVILVERLRSAGHVELER